MTKTQPSSQFQASLQTIDDEIDRQVANALGRHRKILIGGVTVAATLLSSIYAFTRKPIWKGSFEIVLEKQNNSGGRLAQLAASNPMLANLAGVGDISGESSLDTEIKILKSPSVLKPIYSFVKDKKHAAGEDVSGWLYTDWVQANLSIEIS